MSKGTIADTLTRDELATILSHLLGKGHKKKAVKLR
jgi:hypothetical protein